MLTSCGSHGFPINNDDSSPSSSLLLTTWFRRTILDRIENLLLDPGKGNAEIKNRILKSALTNYHSQKMVIIKSDSNDQQQPQYDVSNLSGITKFVIIKTLVYNFFHKSNTNYGNLVYD